MDPSASFSLKRGSTSLRVNNVCGACDSTFPTPGGLLKHQKFHCKKTQEELSELRLRALAFREGTKRRRVDNGEGNPLEGTDRDDAANGDTVVVR